MLILPSVVARPAGGDTHAYWRINVTKTVGSGSSADCTTIQFKSGGVVVHPENFTSATNGDWTVSSPGGTLPVYNVVDGSNTTYHVIGSSPQWIKMTNTTTPFAVDEVCWEIEGDPTRAPEEFTIDYSDDDSSWTTVYTGSGETGWSNDERRCWTF